jgi:hypothetical protein
MFTIRRMTSDLKPAMLEISSHIWDGFDYLPTVFDAWVSDREGEFAAVLVGDRLVGCGKLTFLTPADAWLEGLRKDPRVTEKGLAESVARHFLGLLADRGGLASVRFSTYVKNAASVGPNERLGFTLRTSLSLKAWEGTREQLTALDPRLQPKPSEAVETVTNQRKVLDFFERQGCFEATQGLLVDGWKAYPFSPALLAERYVAAGRCRGVIANGELRAALVDSPALEPERSMVRIVCLDSLDDQSALLLLDDLRARCVDAMPSGRSIAIEWMVPPRARMKQWCRARWLSSWEQEDDFLVYQLPLERLPGFATNRGGAKA